MVVLAQVREQLLLGEEAEELVVELDGAAERFAPELPRQLPLQRADPQAPGVRGRGVGGRRAAEGAGAAEAPVLLQAVLALWSCQAEVGVWR